MEKKKWYQSRTVWANILFIAGGALALVLQEVELTPQVAQWVAVVQGVFNLILRAVTNKGIEAKLW